MIFDLNIVCFYWLPVMRGVWGFFWVRSRSMEKCAHINAGDLGSILAVCACAYDPIHVTAQGKSIGENCACVLTLCTYVPSYECEGPGEQLGFAAFWLVEMGHVNKVMTCPMLMRHVTLSNNSSIVFLALWLVTPVISHVYYCPSQNIKLGIFTGSRAVDDKEMYKKVWCTCKVVVLTCQAIAYSYLTFSSPSYLELAIIYDTLWWVKKRIFSGQIELLLRDSIPNVFSTHDGSSFVSG